MVLRFERVHDVPRSLVRDYLLGRGWAPELIDWKYFDERFNRGRTRGYVWLDNDRVRGLIGVIPARLCHGEASWPVSWACDWSVEAHEENPGIGVFLFQKAVKSEERYIGLGGNENSLKYFPRLAERTIPTAAVEYHIALRLDALLDQAARRAPALAIDRWPVVGRVAVPRLRPLFRRIATRTTPGIPEALESLLQAPRSTGCHPAYDLEHVTWGIGRCPVIVSATTLAPATGPAEAAVIHWHRKGAPGRWHASLWARDGATAALQSCLADALTAMDRKGGSRVTFMVSSHDHFYIAALKSQGAFTGKPTPLFIYKSAPDLAGIDALQRISFHDSDYPVLF